MSISERFLRAKHWQLFALTCALPVVFQMYMMTSIISQISDSNPDAPFDLGFFWLFPVLMIIIFGVVYGWLWSIGIGLQSKIPATVSMKVKKFKIFFFFPVVYIALITTFIFTSIASGITGGDGPDRVFLGSLFVIIIPLHLFCMFCNFYILYFAAKTIKTVEFQREVSFSDFAGEFFLMWFFPIGIWIMQPRLNRIIEGNGPYNGYSGPLDQPIMG